MTRGEKAARCAGSTGVYGGERDHDKGDASIDGCLERGEARFFWSCHGVDHAAAIYVLAPTTMIWHRVDGS
jgi:hypothetical protein